MKYFVLSDIHSFANEMIASLKKAGFKKSNPDHVIIVCGDLWDRGPDALRVYNFLKSIPKKRRIMIRGNHEQLYLELLNKNYPESHDFHNCTVDTFCQIARSVFEKDDKTINCLKWCTQDYFEKECGGEMRLYYSYDDVSSYNTIRRRWGYVVDAVLNHPITKWIKSNEWKNYYELDKYIFVHSFIPTTLKPELVKKYGLMAYGFENPDCFEYNPEWRNQTNWDQAIWGCPFTQYQAGLFLPEEENGKVLVCGHWHTSDFFKKLKHIHDFKSGSAPIYYSEHLIALDGGVSYDYLFEEFTHHQNVMIIDDSDFNTCYDENLFKLVEPEAEYHIVRETVTIKDDGTIQEGMKDFIED